MALTKYKILKRGVDRRLTELGTYETNGPKQAMKAETNPERANPTVVATGESLVAVPEGNWTEQGATAKTVTTIELFDLDGAPSSEPEPEDPPTLPDEAAA